MSNDEPLVAKYAVVCEKVGPARYFSHHDMMRFWERTVRRAGLPVRMTCGFNPRPRIVFPRPLPLGVDSACEMVELELTAPVKAETLAETLCPFMLGGMRVRGVRAMPPRKKGHTLGATHYRLDGPADSSPAMADAVKRLVSLERLLCERSGKAGDKTVDIRPSITSAVADGASALLRVNERCDVSAKPFELVRWFARETGQPEGRFAVRITDTAFDLDRE